MIDARPIVFPVVTDEVNSVLVEFAVPAEAARALLPGTAFAITESRNGRALVTLVGNDYRRGAWGEAATLELALPTHPVGQPRDTTGVYLHDGLASDRFVREASGRTMGAAKSTETVEVEMTDTAVAFRVSSAGEPALTLRLPRVAGAAEHLRLDLPSYSYLDGEPYVTRLEVDLPVTLVDPDAVELTIGTGWFADRLRALGLPRRPDRCAWGEGLTARYHLPVPMAKTGPDEAGPPSSFAPPPPG